MKRWAVQDERTGAMYPQPNKLIAETVAVMHGNCVVVSLPDEPNERLALAYLNVLRARSGQPPRESVDEAKAAEHIREDAALLLQAMFGAEKLILQYCPQHGDLLAHGDSRSERCREAHSVESVYDAFTIQLDHEKVADVFRPHDMSFDGNSFLGCWCGEKYIETGIGAVNWFERHRIDALCEAYTEGKLT